MGLTHTQCRRAKEAIGAVLMPCGCPDCEDGGRFAWTIHDEPPYLDYICLGTLFDEDVEAYHYLCALIAHSVGTRSSEPCLAFDSLPPDYVLG